MKKYRPFHQLPYCCVPATLQWILYRRNLDIFDQEAIGAELGLRMPKRFKNLISNKKIIFKSDNSDDFGTQIEKEEYSIGKFFKKFNIPLQISQEYFFEKDIELINFLSRNLPKKDSDIIIRFNNQIFKKKSGIGHFALIIGLDTKNKKVLIGDPEPPFFKQASIKKIIQAISDDFDGIKRGFYLISEKKYKN